jgi:hypothetical protein
MKLLVRAAAAVPRETPGIPEEEHLLTAEGKAEFLVAIQEPAPTRPGTA